MQSAEPEISPHTERLAAYVAGALDTPLPDAVTLKTKSHILDTFAAILSGSRLKVGRLATAFAQAQGGRQEATLIGTAHRVPAISAALANGMSAHADETDDSHLRGRFHPGCGILPAAFAAAETRGSSGDELIRAVALGYDIGARAVMSLGFARPDTARHSSHSIGPLFGATAAAAALYRLNPSQVRHAFSYAAQQASGIPFWQRDSEHVEKAFDFGGMGARNGMTAVALVAAGFTAVEDPFSGRHSFFSAFGEAPSPDVLSAELGERFEILDASIKKWCVGSPIQSILDAVTELVALHNIRPEEIDSVTITVPDDRIHIIDNRSMPAVCAQHLAALALTDGTVTFESTHDLDRMADPAILNLRSKIRLLPSAELTVARPARQAIVEIERTGGGSLRHHAKAVRGTPDNPMEVSEIKTKAADLIQPIMGEARTEALISALLALDTLDAVRDLGPLLSVADEA
jgi:2-methylcitrate dehydratase PrpD